MNRINLRLLGDRDRDGVFDLLQNSKVMTHIGPRRPLTDDEVLDWINTELVSPSRYVVALIGSDEMIGFCGVKEINGVFDFGYFLREKYWNQGYATEACRMALLKLSSMMNLADIEVFIALDNYTSRNVATKLNWLKLTDITKNGEQGHLYAASM
ncbi:MAG: GNAT family N-acetyltransferase [Blastopirellula sp.]|nr:MAG: GNAT family N-acetyltransferase [Blastopirellula sp.]